MASNDELYKKAMDAINELFSDTSVSKEETLRSMNALIGEIEMLKEALGVER